VAGAISSTRLGGRARPSQRLPGGPRTSGSGTYPFRSYYKVYSSDTVAPTLYWPNPWDGQTISGSSFNFTVSSNDDHAVKQIDLYVDGA
jgi:hypothetical protein